MTDVVGMGNASTALAWSLFALAITGVFAGAVAAVGIWWQTRHLRLALRAAAGHRLARGSRPPLRAPELATAVPWGAHRPLGRPDVQERL